MGRNIGVAAQASTVVSQVPIGEIAPAFRSGDAYRAVGELVQRSLCTALSAAFPRNGSVSSAAHTISTANWWNGVAYGAGVFVAVGETYSTHAVTTLGQYSRDGGKTWYASVMPSGIWNVVAYGAGLFTAIGANGATKLCATSTDGINWTSRAAPPKLATAITFSGSLFVAINSGSSDAMTSADGIAWTARTLPSSSVWSGVVYGNSKFVAVSHSTAGATSADGITWAAQTLPNSAVNVAFGNGLFSAPQFGGSGIIFVYTSADGITWASKPLPSVLGSDVYSAAFGDGIFLVHGATAGYSAVSYDGVAWIEKSTANPGSSVGQNTVAYGGGIFFATSNQNTPPAITTYAETLETSSVLSDYLYLSGTAGQFVRVK